MVPMKKRYLAIYITIYFRAI